MEEYASSAFIYSWSAATRSEWCTVETYPYRDSGPLITGGVITIRWKRGSIPGVAWLEGDRTGSTSDPDWEANVYLTLMVVRRTESHCKSDMVFQEPIVTSLPP